MDTHALWQTTLDGSPIGQCLVGADGRLLAANPALRRMLGYSEAELQALTFADITHPDDLHASVSGVEGVLRGGVSSYRLRKRYLHADGHPVAVELFVAAVREPDSGEVCHLVVQVVDLETSAAEQLQLEDARRGLEHQRRATDAVFGAVDIALTLISVDGTYQTVNDEWRAMAALAFPEGHTGTAGCPGLVFAEDGTTPLTYDEMPSVRAVRGEEFDDYRICIGAAGAGQRALSASSRTIRDDRGTTTGSVLGYKDITTLVAAIRARDRLLAAVSHELRSPLTTVTGHLEMLLDDPVLPRALHERVAVAHRNALRMEAQVSDLIDAAQFERCSPTLRVAEIDAAELVVQSVDSCRPAASRQGVSLRHDVPASLPCVGDPVRLSQVVDNLVSNAVKYSEPGDEVVCRLRRVGSRFEVEVSDTGVGIAPHELEHVFEPFFRSDSALGSTVPGIGLGLAICQQIVEAHGGELSAESQVGRGTTVRLAVPLDGPPSRGP